MTAITLDVLDVIILNVSKKPKKRTKEENESTYTISEVCDRKGTKTMTLGEAVMNVENYIDGKRAVNISPREAEALGMVIAAARQKFSEEHDYLNYISKAEAKDALRKNAYSKEFCTEHNIDRSINLNMANIALNELPVKKMARGGKGDEDRI